MKRCVVIIMILHGIVANAQEYLDGFVESNDLNYKINELHRQTNRSIESLHSWANSFNPNNQPQQQSSQVMVRMSGGITIETSSPTPRRNSSSRAQQEALRQQAQRNREIAERNRIRQEKQAEEDRLRREREEERRRQEELRREAIRRDATAREYARLGPQYRELSGNAHFRTHEGAEMLDRVHSSQNLTHITEGQNFNRGGVYTPHNNNYVRALQRNNIIHPENDYTRVIHTRNELKRRHDENTINTNFSLLDVARHIDTYMDYYEAINNDKNPGVLRFLYTKTRNIIQDNYENVSRRISDFFSNYDSEQGIRGIKDKLKGEIVEKSVVAGKALFPQSYSQSVNRAEDIFSVNVKTVNRLLSNPNEYVDAVSSGNFSNINEKQRQNMREYAGLAQRQANGQGIVSYNPTTLPQSNDEARDMIQRRLNKEVRTRTKSYVGQQFRGTIPSEYQRPINTYNAIFK